jgi:hypothetical protein
MTWRNGNSWLSPDRRFKSSLSDSLFPITIRKTAWLVETIEEIRISRYKTVEIRFRELPLGSQATKNSA